MKATRLEFTETSEIKDQIIDHMACVTNVGS